MSNNEEQFTLEEITASWLGHGKQIPIGKMMAWLIKEVERLHMELPQRAIKEAEIADLNEQIARHKREEADECLECLIDEKEMEILRLSESLDTHKSQIAELHNQLDRLEQETHDQAEQIDTLTQVCQDMKEPAAKWWQVYQDRCEGAWVEATIVKELKADILKLKESAENWKAADREKFDEINRLKDQISTYIKSQHYKSNARSLQIEEKLEQQIQRLTGYLRDAVNALEAMPVDNFQWEKYQRWAEGLRKQTVERINNSGILGA